MAKNKKRVLILDGDPYAFKSAIRHEEAVDWGDGVYTAHTDTNAAAADAEAQIEELAAKLDAEVVFCYGGPNRKYFRHDLGSYKAERKVSIRPMCVPQIKEELADRFESVWLPDLEGDDVIGILMTDPDFYPGYEKIAVSIDKDLKTIPGLYLNPDKMEEPVERTPEECEIFFLSQAIAGDITDGYTGAPGFGMTTAEKLLRKGVGVETYLHTLTRGPRKGEQEERKREVPVDRLWDVVVSCYESVGLEEEDALLNARMARILTADLWDKDNQKPILWSPEHGAL